MPRYSIGNSSSSSSEDGYGPIRGSSIRRRRSASRYSSPPYVPRPYTRFPSPTLQYDDVDDDYDFSAPIDEEEEVPQAEDDDDEAEVEERILSRKRKDRDADDDDGEGTSQVHYNNSPVSVTLTDPDVLDCPICLESLAAPVFQCENGHTACTRCCTKLRNKCPSCSLPIGYNRCRAIEKVLESIKILCRNFKYGCRETVVYSKKHEHEKTCIHGSCSCPHPGCDFVGCSKQLYQHFKCMHPATARNFRCDSSFSVSVNSDAKYVILQEEVERTLFVLNYGVQSFGHVANIICIAPSSLQKGFSYELTARNGDNSVTLKSLTESMPRWSQHLPLKPFLVIPKDFINTISSQNRVHVCIRRKEERGSYW